MSDSKKRKKAYYVQASRAKKHREAFQLDAGMRGFLITCNNAEKKAIREAYNIFNEYADAMYGSEKIDQDKEAVASGDEDDFESAIRGEVEALKNDAAARRFQVVDTKANNCIFIKTTLEHPEELVAKIFNDVLELQKSKSRFILRLLPVLGTCRAAEDKIEKLTEEVLSPLLADADGLTYCVAYKVRCNNTLGRDEIIQMVARVVFQLNPSIKVKFDDPDLVISVDVLHKICCLSVLKNFNKFKKYNLQEALNSGKTAEVAPPPGGAENDKEVLDAGLSETACAFPDGNAVELQDTCEKQEVSDTKDVAGAESATEESSDRQDKTPAPSCD